MKTYRVEYSARAWQPRLHHPLLPAEDSQVVQRVLSDGWHLYVELVRAPGDTPRVVIARLSRPSLRMWRKRGHQTSLFLTAHDLDLVEVP